MNRFTADKDYLLLNYLQQKLTSQSGTSIKKLLKHGCVSINGINVSQHDYIVLKGDCVEIDSKNHTSSGFHHDKLKIIREDNDIIVVDKASGLHSVDTTGHGVENACSILDRYIKRKNPERRIYVVHRLDRDTSGVMIFAKNREAQDRLVKNWNDCVIQRKYGAIVEGIPDDVASAGTIDSYLYEDERKIVHSTDDPKKGLRAITHYKVEAVSTNPEGFSWVECELETGRTNQIRVHLSAIGHPVVGDGKYGSTHDPLGRLGLHAPTIKFIHPMTHKVVSFISPYPKCFYDLDWDEY